LQMSLKRMKKYKNLKKTTKPCCGPAADVDG